MVIARSGLGCLEFDFGGLRYFFDLLILVTTRKKERGVVRGLCSSLTL